MAEVHNFPVQPKRPPADGGGSDGGPTMESRIASLEAHMVHVVDDVRDIKLETREFRKDSATEFKQILADIGAVKQSISSAKVWAALLYAALVVALFATLARGFKFI